jgi:hypothetical protein
MKAKWEMDGKGNHRIIVDGQVGEQAMYAHIATLKVGEQVYAAVSDYYSGIGIPIETVLAILPLETESVLQDSVFQSTKVPLDAVSQGFEDYRSGYAGTPTILDSVDASQALVNGQKRCGQ